MSRKIYEGSLTFNPGAKTITFSDSNIESLKQILIVTDLTTQVMLYNFADDAVSATFANKTLTLDSIVAGCSSTDELQIFYEPTGTDTTESIIQAIQELSARLAFLSGVRGVLSDLRVTPTGSGTQPVSGTVTVSSTTANLGTVATLPLLMTPLAAVPLATNSQSQLAYIGNINRCTAT